MNEENNINEIKEKYQEIYGEDVKVEYNEETGEYIILDENGNEIDRTKSLNEEIEKLDTIENEQEMNNTSSLSNETDGSDTIENNDKNNNDSSNYVGSYVSSSGPSQVNQGSVSGGMRGIPMGIPIGTSLNDDENIYDPNYDLSFSSMAGVISELNEMSGIPLNCDTSYASCLSGELAAFYNTLNDTTKNDIIKLSNVISGLAKTTETCVSLTYDETVKSEKELEELIDELYSQADALVNDMNAKDEVEILTYENYIRMFDNMGELFDGSYKDILERFYVNLRIGHHDFLGNTVPKTLDNIIENTYLRISDEEIGSKEYFEGLEKYKKTFTLKILGDFDLNSVDIEKSNIPEYLWENAKDDYSKTLLVLSYNNDSFSTPYRDNFINILTDSAKENNLEYFYIEDDLQAIKETFSILERTNNFYNTDFEKDEKYKNLNPSEKVNAIIKEYNTINNDFKRKNSMTEAAFIVNFAANPLYDKESGEAWEKTMREFGYLKNIEGKYELDDLYNATFTNDFLEQIISSKGQVEGYKVLKSFYTNYGLDELTINDKLDTLFRSYNPYVLSNAINYNLMSDFNKIGEKITNDKLTLDAAKANFKLGLLESLDTSDITEADIIDAKKLLGDDAKYLEEWQIKGYYKIYQEDKERANNLLSDTLYNIIQDGRGYEKAANTYNRMTGEEQKKFLNQIIHDEIFNDILGKTNGFFYTGIQGFTDGVVGSVRNVLDFALADGKLDENDYYLQYLQQMLSAGGGHNEILKLTYNATSSVGNMTIPMALSAFVSPAAMSAWIFAAETGSSREQALRSGEEDNAMTWINAAAKGLVAVGVERALGALKGYGGKSDDLLKIFTGDTKFANWFMKTDIGKKIALGLSNSVNETIEELVENTAGYGIDFLTGKDIDWQNIPQETWETIYMTMLTTPFINMMGEGFQNSKYSSVNRMNTYRLDGFDIKCSQAEILQFTDANGKFDNKAFFDYMYSKGDRIINIDKTNAGSLIPSSWYLKYKLFRSGLKNTGDTNYDLNNIKNVLRKLELFGINTNEVKQFCTSDGFDYQGFLNYALLNYKLEDSDINKLYKLSDVQKILADPTTTLQDIDVKLANIANDFQIDNINPDSTDYNYLSFLSYLVSRDANFRIKNGKKLSEIAYKLSDIGYGLQQLRYKPELDVKIEGTNVTIKFYGDDIDYYKESVGKILDAMKDIPKELTRNMKDIMLYESEDPSNLSALLSYYLDDASETYFKSGGLFSPKSKDISLFGESTKNANIMRMRYVLSHELGHALDNALGILLYGEQQDFYGNSVSCYFTEENALWFNAKTADGKSLSRYGDTTITEDFAESCAAYRDGLLKTTHSNRYSLLVDLMALQDANNLSQQQKLDLMSRFDAAGNVDAKFNTKKVFEIIFGDNLLPKWKKLDLEDKIGVAKTLHDAYGIKKSAFYSLFENTPINLDTATKIADIYYHDQGYTGSEILYQLVNEYKIQARQTRVLSYEEGFLLPLQIMKESSNVSPHDKAIMESYIDSPTQKNRATFNGMIDQLEDDELKRILKL